MPPWAAFILAASVALVVAVTLTPQRITAGAVDLFASVPATESPVGPELWRWPWQWWPIDDRTLNIALFVPLGIGIGLVGRRGVRWILMLIALASPLVVEGTQKIRPGMPVKEASAGDGAKPGPEAATAHAK